MLQDDGYDYFGTQSTSKRSRDIDFEFEIDFEKLKRTRKCNQHKSQKYKKDTLDFFNLEYSGLNVSTQVFVKKILEFYVIKFWLPR